MHPTRAADTALWDSYATDWTCDWTPLALLALLIGLPMLSWHCWVDEVQLRRTADLMLAMGLVGAGYTYLNADDCWQASRRPDATGALNGTCG